MDSIKLAMLLYPQVTNTIALKEYINSVELSFRHDETFGNEYINISFSLVLNDMFYLLPLQQRKMILGTMEGPVHYTFSLSTNTGGYKGRRQIQMRLLEFKHVYTSLASYITMQLGSHLSTDVPVRVKGIDHWPHINYAEKYLSDMCEVCFDRNRFHEYEVGVAQYTRLQELSGSSKTLYQKQKDLFNVSDLELAGTYFMDLGTIRGVLIHHQVPIKVTGSKIIDTIKIHISSLIEALRKEYHAEYNKSVDPGESKPHSLRLLIEYLYKRYPTEEKNRIVARQMVVFVDNLPIHEGDILELKNGRLVVMKSATINKSDTVDIQYWILKNDLHKSVRTKTIKLARISFFLEARLFTEYKENTPIRRLSLLHGWMKKRKIKVTPTNFKSDFVQMEAESFLSVTR